VDEYEAGGGTELFVEAEARGSLLGYCRLRIPSPEAHRPEVGPDAALLRELRVCGEAVPIGARREGAAQHQGLGRRLLAEAERLAGESGRSRLLVLSGIGARPYFRRSGYRRLGPYMARGIRKT
jgi:elongator complex protein 3